MSTPILATPVEAVPSTLQLLLSRTWCLKSSHSLRTQLLSSFGLTASVSVTLVVILAGVAIWLAGRTVTEQTQQLMRHQVMDNVLKASTFQVAEKITAYMNDVEGTVQILAEAVQDRIVGYPFDGWEEDLYVPFVDVGRTNSSPTTRRYPLAMPPAPLEWTLSRLILIQQGNSSSDELENLQERASIWKTYATGPQEYGDLSTTTTAFNSASYFMQGICDPAMINQLNAPTYYPGCTAENNNVYTGGKVQPTATNYGLYKKSGDFSVFLKPLFEAHPDVLNLGVYFANSGAGAVVQYPGVVVDGSIMPYQSNGCDWMKLPILRRSSYSQQQDPSDASSYSPLTFATADEISRCHLSGNLVPQREYNPLEQEWYRDFALLNGNGSDQVGWFGPNGTDGQQLPLLPGTPSKILHVGKGVFDRRTGHFIGCVRVDIQLSTLTEQLSDSVLRDDAYMAMVRYDDCSLVCTTVQQQTSYSQAQTKNAQAQTKSVPPLSPSLVDEETFQLLRNAVDFTKPWTPQQVHDTYLNFAIPSSHGLLTAYPLPVPPASYDPSYRPQFFALYMVSPTIFNVVDTIEASIHQDVIRTTALAVGLAVLSMVLLLSTIWGVTRMLTQQLIWIESVAWQIVNHTSTSLSTTMEPEFSVAFNGKGEKQHTNEEFRELINCNEGPGYNNITESLHEDSVVLSLASKSRGGAILLKCAPHTDIDELVAAFRTMIQGFSGPGAAKVADMALHEIRNELTWHSEFQQLYTGEIIDRPGADTAASGAVGSASHPPHRRSFLMIEPFEDLLFDDEEEGCNGGAVGRIRRLWNSSPISATSWTTELVLQEEQFPISAPRFVDSTGEKGSKAREDETKPVAGCNSVVTTATQATQQTQPQTLSGQRVRQQMRPSLVVPPPPKRNRGSLLATTSSNALSQRPIIPGSTEGKKVTENDEQSMIRAWHSTLFWWIVVLIVIPMLVINAITCGIVSHHIVSVIPAWVASAEAASYELELNSLNMIAQAKAALMSGLIFESVRDLHLMTRLAGWIFFDGVSRSDSFTEMMTTSEECKIYAYGTCPALAGQCPCDWGDLLSNNQCVNSSGTDTRYNQLNFYSIQKGDGNDPVTGNRFKVTYPSSDRNSSNTSWWDNVTAMPGAYEGENASGYDKTYDRVRVSSVMAIVEQPIYNYATSLGRQKQVISAAIGFDADGLFTGFSGCNAATSAVGTWKSTSQNAAPFIAPSLCPEGKYGYDCRCRDWYATGKQLYFRKGRPVYITPPYTFSIENDDVVTSATSPLTNPRTGQYVGQTVLDFNPWLFRETLEELDQKLSILVTPDVDKLGGDTVVGPNKSEGWVSANIVDLLFALDDDNNRAAFERNILTLMKNGSTGMSDFYRKTADNTTVGHMEKLIIAFAPIYERILFPLAPNDFSRGVNVSRQLVYSVGVIQEDRMLQAPFLAIEGELEYELAQIRAVYIALTVVVTVLFTLVTCIITLHVTKPVITLLRIVNDINDGCVEGDLPPMHGGSREVQRVYNTFAKLYKVVRISNTAFFSRNKGKNLQLAYYFVCDALQLFRKVGDRKAVGIASNNVGNTLFAMLQEAPDESANDDIIAKALYHYASAVAIAQEDFDKSPDEDKAHYALQLSDRLFNRGLFLLHIDGSESLPNEARRRGYQDIARARALDYDVKDYWLDRRLLLRYSADYFCRLMRRINGLAHLYDDVGLREVWDVKELIDDADQLLFAAWNEPGAPLFHEVNRVGRLQQLEAAAILLSMNMGNEVEAAKLAMRMFTEDEFILEGSLVRAAEAILRVVRGNDTVTLSNKTSSCIRLDLRKMLRQCKNASVDIGKCLVFTVELSERWEGDPLLDRINANCLQLYDRLCARDDYMAVVSYGDSNSLSVDLNKRDDNEGRQRTLLDMATQCTSERANPAFPTAFQMLVDSPAALDRDSFMIVIMDGYAWDLDACSSIKSQIERLNRERNSTIHVFVIGLDVEDEDAKKQCQAFCTVTKSSSYTDVTLETIDETFHAIASSIVGVGPCSLDGITMEKF